jgi:KipI family sensor histidine kinase inhibitor
LTADAATFFDVAEGAILVEYAGTSEEEANRNAVALARRLSARPPAGLLGSVPGARTLFVVFDPRILSRRRLGEEIRRGGGEAPEASRRRLVIPAFYDSDPATGPDLRELAAAAGLSAAEFVRRHAAGDYRVAFLGFAPGFPYLTGLPEELHARRLSTPRIRVPAGSIGIGGPYTGIYPEETPGGWRLIGRAAVRLFDVRRDTPALLLPGDAVRFEAIGREEFDHRHPILDGGPEARFAEVSGRPLFRIASPGALTSVQGEPRYGWAMYGVPPGGAMDAEALSHGNRLLGNPPLAPALEMTLVGPELEVLSDAVIGFSGGSVEPGTGRGQLDPAAPCEVHAGDRLSVGPIRGAARAYLCVAGGLARSDGPGPPRRLAAADIVLGRAEPARGGRRIPARAESEAKGELRIRVLPGPQQEGFRTEGLSTFLASTYRVSSASDRRGVRLEGPAIANRRSPDIPPEGTALGGIQVPQDGQPIILGPDRPVTGGYAKIATVIAADFPRVARALPGTPLRFEQVTLAEALAAGNGAGLGTRDSGLDAER